MVVVRSSGSRGGIFVFLFKRTTNHVTIYCMYCICNHNISMAYHCNFRARDVLLSFGFNPSKWIIFYIVHYSVFNDKQPVVES